MMATLAKGVTDFVIQNEQKEQKISNSSTKTGTCELSLDQYGFIIQYKYLGWTGGNGGGGGGLCVYICRSGGEWLVSG